MVAQAFFYNAIFFTYGLVLARFHGVPAEHVGLYMIPFAIGNFLGPLVLGTALRHGGTSCDDPDDVHRSPACCWR